MIIEKCPWCENPENDHDPRCISFSFGGAKKKVSKIPNHCWHCGRKLRGKYFALSIAEGHERVFHKACLKQYREEERKEREISC
jgi:hypothetical protein